MKANKILMVVALLGLTGSAMAATITWVSGNNGNWTDGANWSGGAVPAAADTVKLSGGGSVATIDSDVGTYKKLQTGNSAGGDTINVEAGGAMVSTQTRLANVAGNTSTLNINGGSFTYVDGNTAIGYKGTGIVNVNSGSFLTGTGDDLDLGRSSGSRGELYVNGGTVSVSRDLILGAYNQADNSGHMEVSGGTVNVSRTLDIGLFGTGTVVFSGGSVSADNTRVGGSLQGGNGTLVIDAGGLLTTVNLNIGGSATATGVADLSGGTLHADTVKIGINGTLNIASAATLDTYTSMNISDNGLLVLEGNQNAQVATDVSSGLLTAFNASAEYSDARAYDQEIATGANFVRSAFDGTKTEVWTVIPEPGTLGLVAALGTGLFFIRRHRF